MASKSEGMSPVCKFIYALTLILGSAPFLLSDAGPTEGFGLALLLAGVIIAPIRLEGQ